MKNLSAFFSKYATHSYEWQGHSISLVIDPKPLLTAGENIKFVDNLIQNLQMITTESFGNELEDQTCDGVRSHVVEVDALAFLYHQDKILGFASSKIFSENKTLYLHGVAIAHHFKMRGGGKALVQALIHAAKLPKIALTTQNPCMFCLLKSLCSVVYPNLETNKVPDSLRKLGTQLVYGRAGSLDPMTFIINKLYGRCLYNIIPPCSDTNVNKWFSESLSIQNGRTQDAFLFIGNINQ